MRGHGCRKGAGPTLTDKGKRRPQFQAGLAQPLAPEAETDKLASVPIRERVHAVDTAWKTFLDGKAADWLQDGAVPNFEQVWEFVRDELLNSRRKRSLTIEGLQGGVIQTVEGYIKLLRDWYFPALFPGTVRGPHAWTKATLGSTPPGGGGREHGGRG